MTDFVPFEIKYLRRLNCSLITTNLFYMFLFRKPIQMKSHKPMWLHNEKNVTYAFYGILAV